jgi:hypothetical protein
MLENDKKELLIAPYRETQWLVVSSLFFTIPSYYAYLHHLYFHSLLLFITSIISANYWKKATHSWRRTADLYCAKISFVIFVSNGVYYVRTIPYMITGYSGLFLLAYCYYLSSKLSAIKHPNWYKYHFLFHLLMMYEQLIIIDSMTTSC